jgi:hypothetical protein
MRGYIYVTPPDEVGLEDVILELISLTIRITLSTVLEIKRKSFAKYLAF